MSRTLKYAFRITHIQNVPHVLRCGLVRAGSPQSDPAYVPIGDRQVIKLREERTLAGYKISDYIPFYLGPRSPMLYVIQHGYNGVKRVEPEQIVYCVIRLDDIINADVDCIFTDGHALSSITNVYGKERLSEIDTLVKMEDVYSSQWISETDIDLKRRKEAELLVRGDLPAAFVKGFAVYNEAARLKLEEMGVAPERIVIKPDYYF